jgi:hypothetical protein
LTAPVPTTLEELLHAVVEACVQEIAAARQETASARAELRRVLEVFTCNPEEYPDARAAIRRARDRLEAERDEARREGQAAAESVLDLRKQLEALRLELVEAEDLRARTPRPPRAPTAERSADAATRKDAVTAPSGAGAATTAQPTAVGAFNPRLGAEDLTGKRIGSYICEGKSDAPRRNGGAVWTFRCEACGALKKYSVQDFRRLTKKHVTCPCQVPGRRPPSKPREVTDYTGLVLGSFTVECRQRRSMTTVNFRDYVRRGAAPRCPFCDPTSRQGPPPAPAAPPPVVPPTPPSPEAKPWSGRGRPPQHVRRQREREAFEGAGARVDASGADRLLDERLDELDPTTVGGDDVDDLLSRAMAEAESDGRIRSLAARAARPKAERERYEDLDGEDDEPRAERDPEDEDADEDTTEELDFE